MNFHLPPGGPNLHTTGACTTAALLDVCDDALSWGSGFIFVDGKGDNRLYADVLAMARRYGREDDVLALSFPMTSGNKQSATFNPFAWGNADAICEVLASQIDTNLTGGDRIANHVFMARAVTLLCALTPALVWMRDHAGVPINIDNIRFATELRSIASLAIDKKFRRRDAVTGDVTSIPVDDMEDAALYPLLCYLGETVGYDNTLAFDKQRSDEPARQHSFVVMHFWPNLTRLVASWGHIFKCEIGDVDMRDVVLNRRILVVNLPTLENPGETTASLGRLVVASLRNVITQVLAVDSEGDYAGIVVNKLRLGPMQFPVVFNDVAYYAVPGMDKMLALGRGLGLVFYLGFPEAAGLRQRIGDATYSLLGNADLRTLMRLREGNEIDTLEAADQTCVSGRMWLSPSIAAFIGRGLKLVSPQADTPRPCDPALTPAEWVRRFALVNGRFDAEKAEAALTLQLGLPWQGLAAAPPQVRCMVAAFALHAARRRQDAIQLLGTLSNALPSAADDGPGGPAEPLAFGPADVAESDRILADAALAAPCTALADRHAFTAPALMSVLTLARQQAGVLAPAQFAFLKLVDRPLWYALHSLGFPGGQSWAEQPNPRIEAVGARDHWAAERDIGHPLPVPSLDRSLAMVRKAIG